MMESILTLVFTFLSILGVLVIADEFIAYLIEDKARRDSEGKS